METPIFDSMRIISLGTLKNFYSKHPDAETGIKIWIQKTKKANWTKPDDVLTTFNHARPIKNGRVIFNINRNDYRLIVQVNYDRQSLYVCFIGTHADYDQIDPAHVWLY